MADINLSDYKNLFLQTSRECLSKIEASLDILANDLSNREALDNLHISSHSLKSQSQVMGYTQIATSCLNLEKTSDEVLKGKNQLNPQFILDAKKIVEKIRKTVES